MLVRQVRTARAMGALGHLRLVLGLLSRTHLLAGELSRAAEVIDEAQLCGESMGMPPIRYNEMLVAAWRGLEGPATELIEATVRDLTARGIGRFVILASYAGAVLANSLDRHAAACHLAWPAFQHDPIGFGPLFVPELAEAAARTGDTEMLRAALDWLSERTRATSSDWARGIEARVRAFLSDGNMADQHYRESIACLSRTRVRVELARAHLLYGEWLRRERRRVDARAHLRIASDLFSSMGAEAFAERARRELLATGATVRKRTVETAVDLTAQERLIARFARDGLTNPEIGTRLFLSARTVQYHLRKVFTKLQISSRSQLDRVLPSESMFGSPC